MYLQNQADALSKKVQGFFLNLLTKTKNITLISGRFPTFWLNSSEINILLNSKVSIPERNVQENIPET
jgi:hypothetical protein